MYRLVIGKEDECSCSDNDRQPLQTQSEFMPDVCMYCRKFLITKEARLFALEVGNATRVYIESEEWKDAKDILKDKIPAYVFLFIENTSISYKSKGIVDCEENNIGNLDSCISHVKIKGDSRVFDVVINSYESHCAEDECYEGEQFVYFVHQVSKSDSGDSYLGTMLFPIEQGSKLWVVDYEC